jgi:NADH-quinone oxidoreductase subunit H
VVRGKEREKLTPLGALEILTFPGLTFFVWVAFVFDWLERKTAARVQGRVGPKVTGPFGILQPVADFFKLTFKEEIIPEASDHFVLKWGPALYFAAPAIGTIFIPVLGAQPLVDHPIDLLFVLFILAFSTFMAMMLGYASGGRYSTIAIGRLIVQFTSYEVPMLLCMITPAILAGSLSLSGIAVAQSGLWYIFFAPLAFAVFIVCALAELEKPPFDIPSAKTEIVAGWMTEFSGSTLAYVKLTKSLSYVFLSALAVTLFLGGPLGPVPESPAWIQAPLYFAYFVIKLFLVGFLIFAIRTALARVKVGQATRLFWTILTPLALLQLGLAIIFR